MVIKHCDWFFKFLSTMLECSDLLHIVSKSLINYYQIFRKVFSQTYAQVHVFYISKHNYIKHINSCKF